MNHKSKYMMLGAGITLLAVFGAFLVLFSQVQASVPTPNNDAQAVKDEDSKQSIVSRPQKPEAQTGNSTNEVAVTSSEETKTQESNGVPINEETVTVNPILEQVTPSETNEDDPRVIATVLFALAEKQEKALFNQTGWLHIQEENYVPTAFRGNGSTEMPMSTLFPEDNAFFENWFHVNEKGIVSESLHYITSPDNTITQQSIFADGRLANLTAKSAGLNQDQYESRPGSMKIHQLTRSYAELIESMATWNGDFAASLNGDGYYVVSFTQHYPDGLVDWRFSEPVMASTTTYTFDSETGHTISIEGQLLVSDTWIVSEQTQYLKIETVLDLSSDVAQIFAQSLAALQEGK